MPRFALQTSHLNILSVATPAERRGENQIFGGEKKLLESVGEIFLSSRLSFPATEPPDPRRVSEGVSEGVSERVSEGFSKGFTRVLEGVCRGPF